MSEKVVIETVGPMKEIPNKKDKNSPWHSWSLQFKGDSQWYDTFWLQKEEPKVGAELSGTKSEDPKWGLKFDVDRQGGGKSNWNPAAAQSTVMLAAVNLVNGFLSIPANFELWDKNDPKAKTAFAKYIATVESVSKQLKEKVVAMGAMNPETKTADRSTSGAADPGPGTPPEVEGWPEGEEEVEV